MDFENNSILWKFSFDLFEFEIGNFFRLIPDIDDIDDSPSKSDTSDHEDDREDEHGTDETSKNKAVQQVEDDDGLKICNIIPQIDSMDSAFGDQTQPRRRRKLPEIPKNKKCELESYYILFNVKTKEAKVFSREFLYFVSTLRHIQGACNRCASFHCFCILYFLCSFKI